MTYYNNWLANSGWQYIGVTVIKQYTDTSNVVSGEIMQSQVKIFLDRTLAATLTIPTYFQDD